MSTQPTVADLAHKAMQLNDLLNSEMARQFIRINNIRSNTKLETLVNEQLKGKTAEQVAEICKAPEGTPRKANAKVAEVVKEKPAPKTKPAAKTTAPKTEKTDGKKFERKGREPREVKLVTEGARGFRFGPTWCNSVIAAEGVAVNPANKNKLLKHASSLGINRFTEADDSVKIAKTIAPKVQAALEQAEQAAA